MKYLGKFREMRVNFVPRETQRQNSSPYDKMFHVKQNDAHRKAAKIVSRETKAYCVIGCSCRDSVMVNSTRSSFSLIFIFPATPVFSKISMALRMEL